MDLRYQKIIKKETEKDDVMLVFITEWELHYIADEDSVSCVRNRLGWDIYY